MPFEGQLQQQPRFLVSEGTKYSKYPNNSLPAYCSIFFFLLLIVSCLLGSQTCWWPLNSVCVRCAGVCECVCARVWLPLCPASACALFVFCHVIIFSPVLLIDHLSSGWKVDFCFTNLANSACSPPLVFHLYFTPVSYFIEYKIPLSCQSLPAYLHQCGLSHFSLWNIQRLRFLFASPQLRGC